MVFKAFLMAESSSLPRAPFRNWSGWCFTSRLFRGLGADVSSGVGVGLGVSVGSGVGVGLGVSVGSGVGVGLGVSVGSGVGVGLGVSVGSGVGVGLGVSVGSGVGVGLGVSVGSGVGVGVGSVVGSGLGAVDTGRIFGVELAAVAMVVEGADCKGLVSKAIFSIPYIEIQITISEAPPINRCFSIRSGLRHTPSPEAMVRRSVILSLILRGSYVLLCVRIHLMIPTGQRNVTAKGAGDVGSSLRPYQRSILHFLW